MRTIREFVAEFAPEVADGFDDPGEAFRELEDEGHAEARRLALLVSLEGIHRLSCGTLRGP